MKYGSFRHGDGWAVGELHDDGAIHEVHCSDPSPGVLALVENAGGPRRGQLYHVDEVDWVRRSRCLRRNFFTLRTRIQFH